MAANGKAAAAIGIGGLLVWSGIKGWSLLATLGQIITGTKPSGTEVNPLTGGGTDATGTAASTLPGGSQGGGTIASTAQQYVGHAYRYGGAPGTDGSQPWDCSSFVNWIFSVKFGLQIPGYGAGKYDGTSHGPPTGSWGVWTGLTHVSRASVQAGDLIVWTGHMGIAVDNQHMVSALNPTDTTKVTPIEGYGNGPILCYGRYGYSVSPAN